MTRSVLLAACLAAWSLIPVPAVSADDESEYDVSHAGTVPTTPRRSEDLARYDESGSQTARSARKSGYHIACAVLRLKARLPSTEGDARVSFLESVPENEVRYPLQCVVVVASMSHTKCCCE